MSSVDDKAIWLGFTFTFAASLATTIGSMAAFFVRLQDKHILAGSLGLSAGVMLYVSFVEILTGAREKFVESLNGSFLGELSADVQAQHESRALQYATVFFFSGMVFIALLDLLIHHLGHDHSHDIDGVESADTSRNDIEKATATMKRDRDLKRASLVAALAVALHNIPEGLTTFMATLKSARIGLSVSVAIGIHNVLEGLCVAMPLYFATGSRWRAFLWSTSSGIVEFLGAVLGYVVLQAFMSDFAFGVTFALVGGMMVFVSTRELLPLARRYDPTDRVVTWSLLTGMLFMAICLCISE